MPGFMGQILVVNLTNGDTSTLETDPSVSTLVLGGSGYASMLLHEYLDPSVDPLSPDNILLFMAGPLTGTLAPCTGRHVVCGKSPLTNLWGGGSSAFANGYNLKFSFTLRTAPAISPSWTNARKKAGFRYVGTFTTK